MLLYKGTSRELIEDTQNHIIAIKLEKNFFDVFHFRPSAGEVRSWENSLYQLSRVFDHVGLHDHGILLEYQMPMTSKRLDCLISGKDIDNHDRAVIIELKQWSHTEPSIGQGEVMSWVGGEEKDVLHPSVQAGQYAQYLCDVNTAFYGDNPVKVSACAYLHNYYLSDGDPIVDSKFDEIRKYVPLFTQDHESDFESYLDKNLHNGHGAAIAERIASSPIKTNKKLMDHIAGIIHQSREYVLLDEQKVVYDKVFAIIAHAYKARKRQAVIVKGGPGTGKSVIALNLMADLLSQNINAHYATGSQAFTETIRSILGPRSVAQVKYFNSYTTAEIGSVPVIICDEAHRIRRTSNNRFTRMDQRSNLEQVDEILRTGKICVFFIDDNQVVRPNEIGSSFYIRQHAEHYHFEIWETTLTAQFRCNGSEKYMNWLDNTLDIRPTRDTVWKAQSEEFDLRIMDTPEAVEAELQARVQQGSTARMTAGFCWPWTDHLDKDGKLAKDVKIGSYERPWNASPHLRNVLPANIPKSSLWAHDPNGFQQVGCIYTAQGFEFDYVGVIFGKDLVYNLSRSCWEGHPENSYDTVVKRSKDKFLDLVKHTYRVLMTRGMRACYVYFEDEDTKNYFLSRIEQ